MRRRQVGSRAPPIPVGHGVPITRSVVVDEDRVVDLDALGHAVGIEVLGASGVSISPTWWNGSRSIRSWRVFARPS